MKYSMYKTFAAEISDNDVANPEKSTPRMDFFQLDTI